MKYTYLFLCVFILSGFASVAQTTYPGGVTGCIARWDFTNSSSTFTTLPDVSGNSNPGAPNSLNATTGWRGGTNTAGVFDGTNTYVTVANKTMLAPSAITIVALVKPTAWYGGNCEFNTILMKGSDYSASGGYGMAIYDNDGMCGTMGTAHTAEFIGGPALITRPPFMGPAMTTNNWYLMVTSYDGSFLKRWVEPMSSSTYNTNVSPSSVDPVSTPLGSNSTDIRIGQNQNTVPTVKYPFTGDMDEVVLFNKALSDAEVQAVYNYLWGGVTIDQPFTDTLICPGAPFNLKYTVNNTNAFSAGNVFTAEISDATGNFAVPSVIGTTASTGSGTIICTMPSTASGTGYRVRIRASNPMYTSLDNGKDIATGHAPVTVTASTPSTNVPNNTPVVFTADAPVKGTTITYRWMKNSTTVGTNAATYNATSTTDFKDGDTISVFIKVEDTYCMYTDSVVSNKIVMNVGVGIEKVNSIHNVKIYPNPNTGIFNVSGQTISNKALNVEVLNAIGQVVYQDNWMPLNKQLDKNIVLSNVPAGIYTLRARSDEGISTVRFTVSK